MCPIKEKELKKNVSISEWFSQQNRIQNFVLASAVVLLLFISILAQIRAATETHILTIQAELGQAIEGVERELAAGSSVGVEYVLEYVSKKYLSGDKAIVVNFSPSANPFDGTGCLNVTQYKLGSTIVCWTSQFQARVIWPFREFRQYALLLYVPFTISGSTGLFVILFVGLCCVIAMGISAFRRTEFLKRQVSQPLSLFHQVTLGEKSLTDQESFEIAEIQAMSNALRLLRVRESELIGSERDRAIARTTQMLAHDVRKPFTMFKMIIDAVETAEDTDEAKEILKQSLPDVNQAIASVNGLIQDVMEIGSETKLMRESANPKTLIELTLNELFRVYPESKMGISYSFDHSHEIYVDTRRILRVFSNIVGNAL